MTRLIPIPKTSPKNKTIGERHIYTQELMKNMKKVPEGGLISYEDLTKIIGIDVRPGGAGYIYQKSARDILERDDNIVFEVVKNVGIKRMTPDEVGKSTASIYINRKKSIARRYKRRIDTVSDKFESLDQEAKIKTTLARTIIAFDSELLKSKNILKIENKVKRSTRLIGFNDTLKLFKDDI